MRAFTELRGYEGCATVMANNFTEAEVFLFRANLNNRNYDGGTSDDTHDWKIARKITKSNNDTRE